MSQMLAAAAAARGAGQRRRGADAADQHLRAVRGEDPAAPAGRLRATPCPVALSPGAPRQDAASAGHGAQLAPVLSAQLSIPSRLLSPKSPPVPASPRTCTACARKPRLGGASLLPRAPLCSSPRRLLSPSGCASQRLRHSWDAAREVFVIDPSSPRPGSERFRAGSRRAAVAHAVLSRSLAAACLRCRPSRLPFAVPLTLVAPLSRLCPHRVTAHTAAPPCARPVGCTRPRPCVRPPPVPREPSFPSPGDSLRPHL